MKYFVTILLLFAILSLDFKEELPIYQMELSFDDYIKEDQNEMCFGCGDCSIYCLLDGNFSLTSSGSLPKSGNNHYDVKKIHDYNLKTAWIEGQADFGVREWIEFQFNTGNSSVVINGLYLFNGYRKDSITWKNNSRIKTLLMIVDGKDYAILKLHDSFKYQSVKLPEIRLEKLQTIRFEILSVYPGNKYKDTALSELKFTGKHHH